MFDKNRLINLFLELVMIDSLSLKERNIANRLKKELIGLGLSVKEDNTGVKINGHTGNIVATLEVEKDYPVLLFSAHMDRVEPGFGIKPYIENGYIKSEGDTILAGDDLIGVTVIVEVLRYIIENEIEHGGIIVIFSVAEEIGLLGAKNLEEEIYKKADYGFVLDVDGDIGTVVNRAASQMKIKAIIRGKSAHAGIEPDKGINAIKIASNAISKMRLGKIDEETTANIGVIKGGLASNIVPDFVELEGEARSLNNSKLNKQIESMKGIIQYYTNIYQGSVEFDVRYLYSNFNINIDSKIVKFINKSAADIGIKIKLLSSGGGSDANIFNNNGLKTLNLGTGMELVHSTEERVKVENIIKLAELLLSIINNSRYF